MSQEPTYIGIDVSMDRIDVAVRPTGKNWSVSYDGASVYDLVAQIKSLESTGLITESTGGLELPLVAALAAVALPVAVVNPARCGTSPVDGPAGQDRPAGCSGSGAFRGGGASTDTALARRRHTGTRGRAGAQEAGDGDTCGGEESLESSSLRKYTRCIQAHIDWLNQEVDEMDTDLRQRIQRSPSIA